MGELEISTKNCIVEQEGNVLIVTLNRPEAKNAFSPEMLLGMYKAWRLLEEDDGLTLRYSHRQRRHFLCRHGSESGRRR